MSRPPATLPEPTRRALLRGRVAAARSPLRPPWAIGDEFTEACTRCGSCVAACPEGVVVAGDGGYPEIHFGPGACTFCGACAVACPTGALDATRSEPWHAVASVGRRCLTRSGVVCESCRDGCEAQAIAFVRSAGRVPQPSILVSRCTGCGACVSVCPANAIAVVLSEPEHRRHG